MTTPHPHPRYCLSPLGDAAILLESTTQHPDQAAQEVARLSETLRANPLPGVTDVVCAYQALAVHYAPLRVLEAAGGEGGRPAAIVAQWVNSNAAKPPSLVATPRQVSIPVCYAEEFAPDLAAVAQHAGVSPHEVIARHTQATYPVRAIGFSPGFPYLAGLCPSLHTPRRTTPRTRVPAGSVAIGGAQTGVYPQDSPGGWNLIGRTPLRLFSPAAEPPSLLAVGDVVRFEPIDRARFDELASARESAPLVVEAEGEPTLKVLRPGLQTTVQDLGRSGCQALGVTPGGAMDPVALRLANLLVGNPESAAAIECVLTGPKLRALRETVVAVVGAQADGVPLGRPIPLRTGDVLDLGRLTSGARAYLAIRGGVAAPVVLGGRGTDLRGGFGGSGGRAIGEGDVIHALPATAQPPQAGRWFASAADLAPNSPEGRIRLLRGPQAHWFAPQAWKGLLTRPFTLSPHSDRMGLRLTGPELACKRRQEMTSQPVALGAVQVPPDGQPIVLAADRQTIGGYPVMAVVATVDLPSLAQLRPGEAVRFTEIGPEEAEALLQESEHQFERLRLGIAQHA
ncbi:KipI antagonist [Pirellulimonas nuda]|uniref:KipI antagonist n=1 Tax=Pirellulimonas nuda TaxID=2528009 RepID=A0A518D6V7_9BACT|nr:5-oxoprolinase subunit PxpB [Pirellulimonas nuda]QDU87186.1 KipI antagonist [Pirellulimonas nuda]